MFKFARSTNNYAVVPTTEQQQKQRAQAAFHEQNEPTKDFGERFVDATERSLPFVKKTLSWDGVWTDRTLNLNM